MEAVVVARPVFEQQRGRPPLAGVVTELQVGVEIGGIALGAAERLLPAVGDADEARVGQRAQRRDRGRQRMREVLVFALPKTVAPHHDAAAKARRLAVKGGQGAAVLGAQQRAVVA